MHTWGRVYRVSTSHLTSSSHIKTTPTPGNIRVLVRVRPPLPEEGVRKLPFKFVDSGLGVGPGGEGLCRALEVLESKVGDDGSVVCGWQRCGGQG